MNGLIHFAGVVLRSASSGFTLLELMVAILLVAMLAVALCTGLLYQLQVTGTAQDQVPAHLAALGRMEELRSIAYGNFDQLAPQNGAGFLVRIPSNPMTLGMGNTRVALVNPDLVEVIVTVCWQDRKGRVHGEDANLNGRLDAGEDVDGNGILSSPVQLFTRFTRR